MSGLMEIFLCHEGHSRPEALNLTAWNLMLMDSEKRELETTQRNLRENILLCFKLQIGFFPMYTQGGRDLSREIPRRVGVESWKCY